MLLKSVFKYKLAGLLLLISAIDAVYANDLSHNKNIEKLPVALSNNAVAGFELSGDFYMASFYGLTTGKTWRDIVPDAYLWSESSQKWRQLPAIPGKGRLAAAAVAMNHKFYIAGGYTVNGKGEELSTPEVYSITKPWQKYRLETHMPVPVDDAVLATYQDHYLFLVSGWHDSDNVSRVQIFDSKSISWKMATPFPGVPVFGHAGAIRGNKILIVDGVGVVGKVDGKRQFATIAQSWLGEIDPQHPENIHWQKITSHPGQARYRMAAVALNSNNQIVFIGGSTNPYNYNGIGYNKIPSEPSAEILLFDLDKNCWLDVDITGPEVMDLRGAILYKNTIYTLGGMGHNQQSLKKISSLDITLFAKEAHCQQ